MADIGQKVLGVDIDEVEAEMLNSGKAWFRGPGLDEMLIRRSLLQRGAFMNYRHKTRGACRTGKAR